MSASGMPMPVSLMAMLHVAARARQMHVDAAAVAGELHRVGQEIEEHLLQRAAVGFDHQLRRAVAGERDIALAGGLANHLHAVLDDVGDVDVVDVERHAAGLDLRHVEDVVDHLEQIGCRCAWMSRAYS